MSQLAREHLKAAHDALRRASGAVIEAQGYLSGPAVAWPTETTERLLRDISSLGDDVADVLAELDSEEESA